MYPRGLLVLATLTGGAAACGHAPPAPASFSAAPSQSSYSSSFSKAASTLSVSAPTRRPADLIVKPDLLQMNFALRKTAKSSQEGIAVLKAEVGKLEGLVAEVSNGTGRLRPCRFSVNKSNKEWVVSADGALEIPLGADSDYWARSELIAGLSAATDATHQQVEAQKEAELYVGFSPATLLVQDVEQYRSALTDIWHARTRAFIKAAEQKTELALVECDPPGAAIHQETRGLEEVGLSLPVRCKIGKSAPEASR